MVILRLRGWLMLALLMALAACTKRGNENVVTRFEGSHLVIENRSGEDVHLQLLKGRIAWIPASLPGNLLPDGQSQRMRMSPSERGQSIELVWWRPGKEIDKSGVKGPDRLRRIAIELPALTEALADDELLIQTCLALGSEAAAEYRERPPHPAALSPGDPPRPVSEATCVKLAEDQCPNGRCRMTLASQQQQLEFVRDARKRHRNEAGERSAAATAGTPQASSLAQVAKAAFDDLASGQVAAYVARLCPSLRESYAGNFMQGTLRKLGEDFKRRGLALGKASQEGPGAVTFDAVDQDMQLGRKPPTPTLAIKASFERAQGQPCLSGIEELRR